MPFEFFLIPIRDDGQAAAELNAILRSHRALAVERNWVEQGTESYWTFCVDYHDGKSSASGMSRSGKNRAKDYKAILSPEDFAVFARLRDLRKEIAQREAVPVYTVFTNEQLAQMVEARCQSKADLETITGVGDARSEKYGPRLKLLKSCRFSWRIRRCSAGNSARNASSTADG